MTGTLELLVTILPRALLAAISPVLFVNAATFVLRGQTRSAVGFLAGAGVILMPIGVVSAGVLGATLATQLGREIASRTVDTALGVLLLVYGLVLIRANFTATPAGPSRHRSAVPFGMISMATNFTTLPLYLSATQHIGAARPPVWAMALLLVLVTAVTLAPAWLPIVMARLQPGLLARVTERTSSTKHRKWSVGTLIPIAACLFGGGFLIVRSLSLLQDLL